MADALFTASDLILGAGILGLYGYLWKVSETLEKNQDVIGKKIDSINTRVACLEVLHVQRHPEDQQMLKSLAASLCTEGESA